MQLPANRLSTSWCSYRGTCIWSDCCEHILNDMTQKGISICKSTFKQISYTMRSFYTKICVQLENFHVKRCRVNKIFKKRINSSILYNNLFVNIFINKRDKENGDKSKHKFINRYFLLANIKYQISQKYFYQIITIILKRLNLSRKDLWFM